MKHVPSGAAHDIAALGATADRGVIERLEEFTGLLEKGVGGRFGNLLGPLEMRRLWSRHILESVAYIPLLARDTPVVDIGSGAGFPGVVLSLFGFQTTLVESRRKRFLFLLWVSETMNLGMFAFCTEGWKTADLSRDRCPSPQGPSRTHRALYTGYRSLPANPSP